jgi:hypothetical protein
MYVYLYIDAPSYNNFCREKAGSIIYFERVLVIQHAKRMRHVIFSSVACLAVQSFPHYLINDMIFGKKVNLHKISILIFSSTFVWNISHQKNSARYCHICT